MNRRLGARGALVFAVCLAAPTALGCIVETPIVSTEVALETLADCLYCPVPADASGGTLLESSAAYVDTLVVTTFRLEAETDCRSCIEDGECEVQARDCICLGGTEPLAGLDIEAALAGLTIPSLSRQEQYCVAVATVRAETAPGEECTCTPSTWGLGERAALSCTYSRRAKSPSEGQLVLSTTICQSGQRTKPGEAPGPPPPSSRRGSEPGGRRGSGAVGSWRAAAIR